MYYCRLTKAVLHTAPNADTSVTPHVCHMPLQKDIQTYRLGGLWHFGARITRLPMMLQCLKLVNHNRPVTQVALVAVKVSQKIGPLSVSRRKRKLSITALIILSEKPTAMYLNSDRFLCRFFMYFISFISNLIFLCRMCVQLTEAVCIYPSC